MTHGCLRMPPERQWLKPAAYVVLYHCRLCVRPCLTARYLEFRYSSRRQGARKREHAVSGNHRFFVLFAAGPGFRGQSDRIMQCGTDTINCIKQAHEFGVTKTARIAGLLVFISDIHALGLQIAQGLVLSGTFYWNLNPRTRAFSERVAPKMPGVRPGMAQAGCYSATLHYLKTVAAMGVVEAKRSGAETVARMKAMPMDDDVFGPGSIRADGRAVHPAYLFEVKKPEESKEPWDYYNVLAEIPANEAFRPINEGSCPLVHA